MEARQAPVQAHHLRLLRPRPPAEVEAHQTRTVQLTANLYVKRKTLIIQISLSFCLQSSPAPAKSPKRKESQSGDRNKKPPVVKKSVRSGFVTNTNVKPRPISDEDSEAETNAAKKKNNPAKKPLPNKPPKVVPKKSATAKPVTKSNISKSKRFVDTETESELDEPAVSKPASKATGSSNQAKSVGTIKSTSKKKTRAGLV